MSAVFGPTIPDVTMPPDGSGGSSYYSVAEAAAFLGVSRVTIWRWVKAGRLPIWRLGHRTARIKREDLDRLLIERTAARSARAEARADSTPSAVDEAVVGHGGDHIVQ